MARKDDILKSFLEHELISSKYGLSKDSIPNSVRDGLKSETPIIKAISLIINALESIPPTSDASLYKSLSQYLNTTAL